MENNNLKNWKEDKNLQRFMDDGDEEVITVEEQKAEKLFKLDNI